MGASYHTLLNDMRPCCKTFGPVAVHLIMDETGKSVEFATFYWSVRCLSCRSVTLVDVDHYVLMPRQSEDVFNAVEYRDLD